MNRKFSIIMPTFNRPQFINRAIQAILDQDYDNWELIIQNGGEPINNIYDDERIKIFNEPDKGITDAMNKGMKKATGDVFNWQNDDDEMSPFTLAWVDENMDAFWGYGYIEMTDGTNRFDWGNTDPSLTLRDLTSGNFVPQPSVYWTRSAYEKVGSMDENEDLTSDYEYWMRLWRFSPPQRFQRKMADYHIHSQQITQTRQAEQVAQARESAKKYLHI